MPASSVNLVQAVAVNNSSAAFFVDPQLDLVEKTSSGKVITVQSASQQAPVQAFSAGVDRFGNADAFVQIGSKVMVEFNSQGAQFVVSPVPIKEFTATHGDRLYEVGTDNSLWMFSPSTGFKKVLGAGQAQYVDAVTRTGGSLAGHDELFVVRGNSELDVANVTVTNGIVATTTVEIAIPNFFRFDTISAGLDVNGNGDVFALSTAANGNQLWRFSGGVWTALGSANEFTQISATNGGTVFCLTSSGSLDKFDAHNSFTNLYNNSFFAVAAASSNDVYVADTFDSSLWELTGTSTWHEWAGPGSVL
ncbi:MAG: hypothetical protein JOY66_16610 [Acetobacteraceae bacterium]|nr:hypothetical protein [Acetobacteraceae bacterium]